MPRLIVELKPFDLLGAYQSDWIDITKDVIFNSIGSFNQKLDNDTFNTGILKNSSISLSLSNEHGRYGEVGEVNTLFNFTRNNSLVRISWNINIIDPLCGVTICGESLPYNDNVVLFTGLLNDDSLSSDISTQEAKFQILGIESIFSQVETPYSSITVGDTFEEILYTCLNQTKITDLLTVSASNINVGTNQEIDVKTDWENTTIQEVIGDILEASGSVLYIENDIIYIKGRTQSLTSSITFYGQASNEGVENIQKLNNIKSGINKCWNYWTWEDTTLVSQDATSVSINGIRKKEIGYFFITNNTKRSDILDYNLAEFKNLKEEFECTVLAENESIWNVEILSGANIDYPTVFKAPVGEEIPIYGVAVYGESVYPIGEWAKTIDSDTVYKIMGKKYNLKSNLITFYLREV